MNDSTTPPQDGTVSQSILSISQAARLWKKSRPWLYTLKSRGELNFTSFPDGSPGISVQELLRVFGEAGAGQRQRTTTDTPPAAQDSAARDGRQEQLRHALERLEDVQRERDAALEREQRLLALLEQQTRLLQHQGTGNDTPGDNPGWLWDWLTKPRRLF